MENSTIDAAVVAVLSETGTPFFLVQGSVPSGIPEIAERLNAEFTVYESEVNFPLGVDDDAQVKDLFRAALDKVRARLTEEGIAFPNGRRGDLVQENILYTYRSPSAMPVSDTKLFVSVIVGFSFGSA